MKVITTVFICAVMPISKLLKMYVCLDMDKARLKYLVRNWYCNLSLMGQEYYDHLYLQMSFNIVGQ